MLVYVRVWKKTSFESYAHKKNNPGQDSGQQESETYCKSVVEENYKKCVIVYVKYEEEEKITLFNPDDH